MIAPSPRRKPGSVRSWMALKHHYVPGFRRNDEKQVFATFYESINRATEYFCGKADSS
jgi:hypothetical protein